MKEKDVSKSHGEKCDWCGERTDFNTELRVAPTNPSDKLIWGRMKICPKCREEVTVKDIYEFIIR